MQSYKTGHTLRLPIGPFLKFQQQIQFDVKMIKTETIHTGHDIGKLNKKLMIINMTK